MSAIGPVPVDLICASLRLSGLLDAGDDRRFSDVLNADEPVLSLRHVRIRDHAGSLLDGCELAVIEKREVLLAVPRESDEQLSAHRNRRIGILPPYSNLLPLPALVATPPFTAAGILNYPSARGVYEGTSVFPRFFPLLDATLRLGVEVVEQGPVLLVNRGAVVSIGIMQEAALRSGRPSLRAIAHA